MTGATSPRLHLELMVARLLVPAADNSDRGALARVERLERRIGIDADATVEKPLVAPEQRSRPAPQPIAKPVAKVLPVEGSDPTTETAVGVGAADEVRNGLVPEAKPAPVSLQQLRDSWPEILEVVQKAKRTAWMVVYTSTPRALNDDVLTLSFPSETDVSNFKERPVSGDSVSEQLRAAITAVLGIRVKFVARVDATGAAPAAAAPAASDTDVAEPANGGWNVTAIPGSEAALAAAEDVEDVQTATAPETEVPSASGGATESIDQGDAHASRARAASRYGEAVVRELLGASFIEEQSIAPRDQPVTLEPASESASAAPGSTAQESAD